MKDFIMDIKENQKQLDSLIKNNKNLAYYYDSIAFVHGFTKSDINLEKLSMYMNLWVYRFTNKKTIFEQMKSSGSLRYIQDKEVLNAILRYEESANLVEARSIIEIDQYNNEFRPSIAKILPLSFFKYLSESEAKEINKMDTIVHPGRYENYKKYSNIIKQDLENTKLSSEEIKQLAKTWHFRQERITVGLRFQMELYEKGLGLLKLLESKYHE
jgi:hypothetical protein